MKDNNAKYKVSIMGDSISTYEGFNHSQSYIYYTDKVAKQNGLESVQDTWWHKVIEFLGGELCENSSYAGSAVTTAPKPACSQERCLELHNVNGNPDIVLVYMGTNDRGYGIEIGIGERENTYKFYGAYRLMLKQIKENYPKAKIICATLLLAYVKGKENMLTSQSFLQEAQAYNDAIRLAVGQEHCTLVDIANYGERYESIDGCHPTKKGHNLMAKLWIECIKNIKSEF